MFVSLVGAHLAAVMLVALVRFDLFSIIYGSMQVFLVLQFTYVILLLQGVNKMVDIVTNRMFDTYNRFSPSNNHHTESIATLTTLRRFSKDQKLKRRLDREADLKERQQIFTGLKESTAEVVIARKTFSGLSCPNCTPESRSYLLSKTTESLALKNVLHYQLPRSSSFLKRTYSHLHQACVLKKYEYPRVTHLVLKDERLRDAVKKATDKEIENSPTEDKDLYEQVFVYNQKRANKLLVDMRSTLSDFLLRFTSWVLYKLLPCFLTSVVVHPGQVDMLKKAAERGIPLIFLPLHRSHLDYILMSFILLNNNIKAPLVAAGDNLRIPFFGSLLRGLGAFFIRRRMDPVMGQKDIVYKSVLHTYMNTCLKEGHNIEFFLEGGRTRTGKPCMPKYGILSVIIDSYMDGSIENALLVPVSINYEKLVDGNFVREQLGQPKQMETFGNAIRGIWKVLNSNYGMMRIDFNQPISLKELVKTFNTDNIILRGNGQNDEKCLKSEPSTSSIYGTDVVRAEDKVLVERISKHIMYDCAQSTCVMSTNALAFLLLTKYREGVNIKDLVVAFDNLRQDLLYARKCFGFTGDSIDVVNYAVKMLGPALVRKEKVNGEVIIKPITILPNVIELSYYSNTLVTHYVLDSVIAIAIQTLDNPSGDITHSDLVSHVTELCDIMQYEFLFCKPCQRLDQMIISCIDDLRYRKQIFFEDGDDYADDYEDRVRSQRIAKYFDDDNDDCGYYPGKIYSKNSDKEIVDNLKQMRTMLAPLVETYAVTAFTLDKLVGRQLLESQLLKDILDELNLQLDMGTVKYGESVSVDSIKNALRLYQRWGILECYTEDKTRLYYLSEGQDDSESVTTMYQKVNKFRRALR